MLRAGKKKKTWSLLMNAIEMEETDINQIITQRKIIINWFMLWRESRLYWIKRHLALEIRTEFLERWQENWKSKNSWALRGSRGWTEKDKQCWRIKYQKNKQHPHKMCTWMFTVALNPNVYEQLKWSIKYAIYIEWNHSKWQ